MQKEVKKSWALFIGIGTMMIAHGLQMQIMGIRSVIEDFSVFLELLLILLCEVTSATHFEAIFFYQ